MKPKNPSQRISKAGQNASAPETAPTTEEEFWSALLYSRTPVPAGIDTIRLVAPFYVQYETGVQVIYDHRTPWRNRLLWTNDFGESVYGVMAKWTTPEIQIRISPPRGRAGEAECWISFSAPKLIYGSNAPILAGHELQNALYLAENMLLDLGIAVDVQAAKVSRVDICRHLNLPRPVKDYMPLLSYLDMKHGRYGKNYETGITRGNKSQSVVLYDKRAEMRSAHNLSTDDMDETERPSIFGGWPGRPAPGEELLEPGHIMRQEWRLRNARTVRDRLNVRSAQDLVQIYDSLTLWLDETLRRHLFREDAFEPPPDGTETIPGASPAERWLTLLEKAQDDPKSIKALLMTAGWEYLSRGQDEYQFQRYLKRCFGSGNGRSTWDRLKAQIRRERLRTLAPDGMSYARLQTELLEAGQQTHVLNWSSK